MTTPGGDQPDYGSSQPGGSQPAGYGAPNYPGDPSGLGGSPQAPKNGLGIAALVLGIIGLVLAVLLFFFPYLGGLLGILAIIFGIVGMSRAKKGEATNRGVALGGLITGILAVVVAIVVTVLVIFVFVSAGGGDYVSCVQQANGDQAKVQQCVQQFAQQNQN